MQTSIYAGKDRPSPCLLGQRDGWREREGRESVRVRRERYREGLSVIRNETPHGGRGSREFCT
jgi:hypothetical protein